MTQWSTIEKSIIEEIEELVQSKADCLSGEMVVCPNPLWGDVSLPCFALAKILKKSPDEIAKTLAEKISDHVAVVLSARADGGFLNITLTNKALFADVLTEVFEKKEEYGKPQHPLGTYIVEYASPNTNKPLHLGHLHFLKDSDVSSGFPFPVNLTSFGKTTGKSFSDKGTNPHLSQYTTGMGVPQYLCLEISQSLSL